MGASAAPVLPPDLTAIVQGGAKPQSTDSGVPYPSDLDRIVKGAKMTYPRDLALIVTQSAADQPKPEQPGLWSQVGAGLSQFAHHPITSTIQGLKGVATGANDALLRPVQDEAGQVHDSWLEDPLGTLGEKAFGEKPISKQAWRQAELGTLGNAAAAAAAAGTGGLSTGLGAPAWLAAPLAGAAGGFTAGAANAPGNRLAGGLTTAALGALGGAAVHAGGAGFDAAGRALRPPPVPEETPALAPTPAVAEPTAAPTPEAPNARPVVARAPAPDLPRGNAPVSAAPPPESVERVTGGKPPAASSGPVAGPIGEPESVSPALAKARAQWGLNEPPEGSPAGTPAAKLVNPDLLALSPEGQGELQSQLEQLKAQGFDKRIVSFPEQQAQARDFAQQLGLDPLSVDPQKYSRLSGAEIVGMKNVVVKNIGEITDLSKQIAVGQMSTADIEQASARLDALRSDNDVLLRGVVTASGQAGRDLGFLRTMAQGTLDPDAWMVQAQKIAGNRALSDEEITSVRALAKAAQDACLGEGV